MNFEMKISSNRHPENIIKRELGEKGIVITQNTIDSVVCKRIFIEPEVNKMIQAWHRRILTLSAERIDSYPYGEVGILASLNMDKNIYTPKEDASLKEGIVFYGNYYKIKVSEDSRYINAVANAKGRNLIFMHNHPSGSSFSYEDIHTFVNEKAIQIITAIGNNGRIYVISKGLFYDNRKVNSFLLEEIKRLSKKYPNRKPKFYQSVATRNLLKRAEEFGFDYIDN